MLILRSNDYVHLHLGVKYNSTFSWNQNIDLNKKSAGIKTLLCFEGSMIKELKKFH